MIFHVPPEVPPACPKCAALESEVARLTVDRDEERKHTDFYIRETHKMQNQRNDARVLLRELAEEAQSILDHLAVRAAILADDPRLQRLRSVLRRVDAEAGEKTR